jgi:branched-chain amino acid transport system ATP-binding protein
MSVLEITNLRKSFGGIEVISDLNLSIPSGRRHALIGPNGAGKTTLFNLITGWLRPDAGEIRIGRERVVPGKPVRVARAGLSRSFQRNMLLEGLSTFENLRIACQAFHSSRFSVFRSTQAFDEVVTKARDVAERMNLGGCLRRTVRDLSYGQKRQLEVAMALCAEPRVLLMDEPAAGTSPSERARLIELVEALPRELTILMVEHDMDVVFAVCDVITVLSYGKVLATGTKSEIQSNPAVMAAYLGGGHA